MIHVAKSDLTADYSTVVISHHVVCNVWLGRLNPKIYWNDQTTLLASCTEMFALERRARKNIVQRLGLLRYWNRSHYSRYRRKTGITRSAHCFSPITPVLSSLPLRPCLYRACYACASVEHRELSTNEFHALHSTTSDSGNKCERAESGLAEIKNPILEDNSHLYMLSSALVYPLVVREHIGTIWRLKAAEVESWENDSQLDLYG